MTRNTFVEALTKRVRRSSIDGTVDNLSNPPGRDPWPLLVKLSEWYNHLPSTDQANVALVVQEGVDNAIFGLLCVLDGVRSVADDTSQISFRLTAIDGEGERVLNDPKAEYLHDRYQEAIGKVQ